MILSEISIRRPVFAWMLMLSLIVFGAVSFTRLGVSQLPDVDFPMLSIGVRWEGAAPEVLESEIVDRIEQAVISVEGLKELSSTIRQGQATVSLEFDIDRDVDSALQEVQAAISRVRLPIDVEPPTIRKENPEDQPIMWLGIASKSLSLRDLITFVELNIKDQFQIIPGVGEILLGGYTDRNLRVWVDNEKLKKYELTILDVRDALQRGNLEVASGTIENSQQEMNVRFMGEGGTPDGVADIVIPSRGGRPIYGEPIKIKDIGRVEDGLADVRRISRLNGEPGIGIGIRKQRGANSVEIGQRVRERMAEIRNSLPGDIKIDVNFDTTVFVEESVEESEFTLVLSAIVTAFVCWLFLGSLRPTFNILLSIPTSIIGTFTVIYFLGFTLNLFTILALALAIGIVVDDAIMVLENIYRHNAMGKGRVQASLDGAREITFAATAATLAVIAIFLPVAFMTGIIGKFFFQFGVTISVAVGLSLLEAITLTPMRCSQIMESVETRSFVARFIDRMFSRIAGLYALTLRGALKIRWIVVIVSIAVFYLSLEMLPSLRKEFIPPQDQSVFIARIETPVGSSLQHTADMMREIETFFLERKDVQRVFLSVGGFGGGEVNTATAFVSLVPKNQRTQSQSEIMLESRKKFSGRRDLKFVVQDLSTRGLTPRRGFPIDLNIRGPEWGVLDQSANEIVRRINESGLVADADTDYRLGQPEVRVWPDREAAARLGVPMESISNTIAAAIGGIREGKFTQDGRRYDVRLRLEENERSKPADITDLTIRNIHGELIPINQVVRVENVPTLQTITRRNRERSISVYANLAEGASQAEALQVAQKVAKEVLPPNYRVFLGGSAQTFSESFESLIFVLWLGVVVAYMILASQFNSFLQPIVVLLSLPFSLTGALLALHLADQSINLFSMIGIILLMGIVKKNAILLVEFANHKIEVEKLPLKQAIIEASPVRLRPILMTSLATIAAAVPPALALGPGAETRIPMAITIVGGVIVSTFFTLYLVPCVYYIFTRESRPVSESELN